MRTRIACGWLVANEGRHLWRNAELVYEGSNVVFIGERFEGPVDHEIDAGDKLVAPGFIDTHVHSGHRASHWLISDIGRGDYFGQPFLEISVAREGARPGRTGNLLLQPACRFGELINIGTDRSLLHALARHRDGHNGWLDLGAHRRARFTAPRRETTNITNATRVAAGLQLRPPL
jgi:hypothetical protein